MSWMRKSPWVAVFNSGGCNGCVLETLATLTPRYDIERFGCVWKSSARHADILLVTGPVTRQSLPRLKTVYDQIIHHLPQERNNVKHAFVKLTMSKPVKIV